MCLDIVEWRGNPVPVGRSMRRDYNEQQRWAAWDKANRRRWARLYTNFMIALMEAKERRAKEVQVTIERHELDHRDSPAMRYHFHKMVNVPSELTRSDIRKPEYGQGSHLPPVSRKVESAPKEPRNPFDFAGPPPEGVDPKVLSRLSE